ncbi:MAG: FKBP-type peptidyl-prolyl cis-trans isomerase [Bacteroidetes bacterium]|nr:FKBP-type peptidyl-prolyl cis-trans isomerase [Bacteroidota bacterium]
MKKLVVAVLAITTTAPMVQAQVKSTPKPKPAASAPVIKNLMDSFSYAVGVNIGNNMKSQGITEIKYDLMVKAMEDVFKGKNTTLNEQQCNSALQTQMGIFGKVKAEEGQKAVAAEKAKSAAFLAGNKSRPGVISLDNGMQYEIIKSGDASGIKPTAQDTVLVDYAGTLIDGRQFDASIGRGEPVKFALGQVIRGWVEILQLMKKGDIWKVYIPSDLAYGDTDNGPLIKGGSLLIFEIRLLDVFPATVK